MKQRNDLHEDIFEAVCMLSTTKYDYKKNQLEYQYKINPNIYCDTIKRSVYSFAKGNMPEDTEISIFDTPNEFFEKNSWSWNKPILNQTDKFCLLIFIQN